jgi:hypothetical protein
LGRIAQKSETVVIHVVEVEEGGGGVGRVPEEVA